MNEIQNKTTTRKLPTTNKMVDEAFMECKARKGITLRGIYTYIASKYAIVLTKQRETLIKKYLTTLRESEQIFNTTGKGFSGHMKLLNKRNFEKYVRGKIKHKETVKKPVDVLESVSVNQVLPPSQVYEMVEETSAGRLNINQINRPVVRVRAIQRICQEELDSPMAPTHISTPISRNNFPLAPRKSKTSQLYSVTTSNDGTPRSSNSTTRTRRIMSENNEEMS
ncbi:uncharacterized protein LOC142242502 [Haematobia irritans]|uniref:uncharacterized protein LOC142242502 n=1 Tax=Haematobia irritans TaxID=7368 RepID=UPI003F4F6E4C